MSDSARDDVAAAAATVAARMDRLPVTPLHRRATILIGLGLFFDIYEVFLAGVLGAVLGRHFRLGTNQLSLLLASAFLGMFLGALTLGRLADRVGRRGAFLASMGLYSAFSLIGAFSMNPLMLVASRFFAGSGIGAEPPIADTYLSDLLPRHSAAGTPRGRTRCRSPGYRSRASSAAGWCPRRRWESKAGDGCS